MEKTEELLLWLGEKRVKVYRSRRLESPCLKPSATSHSDLPPRYPRLERSLSRFLEVGRPPDPLLFRFRLFHPRKKRLLTPRGGRGSPRDGRRSNDGTASCFRRYYRSLIYAGTSRELERPLPRRRRDWWAEKRHPDVPALRTFRDVAVFQGTNEQEPRQQVGQAKRLGWLVSSRFQQLGTTGVKMVRVCGDEGRVCTLRVVERRRGYYTRSWVYSSVTLPKSLFSGSRI